MSTDRVSASVLALLALFVIWERGPLPLGTLRQPGPAFVPVLLASLLLIFSICLIGSAASAPSLSSLQWTEGRHALAILIACVFSVLAIERLGYRLTMLLLLGVLVKFVEK